MMERIDNYTIVEKIGEGGMGEVYKGIDTHLDREVAIKMLRPELSRREDVVSRFQLEAKALARLNHPNIATVFSFGQFEDQYYMVMEFVPGVTLDSVLQNQGRLPWRDAVHYAIQALQGLAHAHQAKVIHRDIKPANMMITGGSNLKLLDFGIARILQTARLTRLHHTIGTVEYMSPEQHQGKEFDARADIYAIGTMLYEMLTGQYPFKQDSEYTLIKAVIEDKPASLRGINNSIPAALEKMVLRALEKKPEKRFADAQEFILALRNCLAMPDIPIKKTRESQPIISTLFNKDSRSKSIPSKDQQVQAGHTQQDYAPTRDFDKFVSKPAEGITRRALKFLRNYPVILSVALLITVGGGYALWPNNYLKQQPPEPPKVEKMAGDIRPEKSPDLPLPTKEKTPPSPPPDISQPVESLTALVTQEKLAALQKAAGDGDVKVQLYLGNMYALGKGVAKDGKQAIKWYQEAVNRNNAEGQYRLGRMLIEDKGNQKNVENGITWLQKAAGQDHVQAQSLLGDIYLKGKLVSRETGKAYQWIEKAASHGDALAQENLGEMYFFGSGVPKQPDKALLWFQDAAKQGNEEAQYNLAVMYEEGMGGKADKNKAFEWYKKSAEQGYDKAQNNLGRMYYEGKGVKKNDEEAFAWFRKAADQENASGLYNLGNMYKLGLGVDVNIAKARELYQQAAARDHAGAKKALVQLQSQTTKR